MICKADWEKPHRVVVVAVAVTAVVDVIIIVTDFYNAAAVALVVDVKCFIPIFEILDMGQNM